MLVSHQPPESVRDCRFLASRSGLSVVSRGRNWCNWQSEKYNGMIAPGGSNDPLCIIVKKVRRSGAALSSVERFSGGKLPVWRAGPSVFCTSHTMVRASWEVCLSSWPGNYYGSGRAGPGLLGFERLVFRRIVVVFALFWSSAIRLSFSNRLYISQN